MAPYRNKALVALFYSLVLSAPTFASVSLDCRIEPKVEVDLSAAVEGVVESINVKKNDKVEAGQIVATLESELEKATVELREVQASLQSDIQAQQLAVDYAERALKRVQDLYDKKAASFAELDKAKTEKAIASQRLEQANDRQLQAKMELKRAVANLARYQLTSPIDGVIVDILKDAGEHVENEAVLRIAQLDPLQVVTFVPASLYGKIEKGTTAKVKPEISVGVTTYKAEVTHVDKIVDAASNTFSVHLTFANPRQDLPSGLRCTVDFANIHWKKTPI